MLLLLLACRTATVVDACASDPAFCLPCSSAEECVFTGNPCTETVYCAHRDASIAVIEIGCSPAIEYAWPPEEDCACVEEACTAEAP